MEYKIFRDFDAFAATVRGIDSKMMFHNPKDRIWSIGQLKLSGIEVQLGKVGSGNIVEGESKLDGYLFYLPLTNNIEYLANGRAIDVNSMALFGPGCDFYMATTEEHDWCSAFIPTTLLPHPDELLESLLSRQKSLYQVINSNQKLINRFRYLMLNIDFASTQCSDFHSTPAARIVTEELQQILFSLLPNVPTIQPIISGRSKIPREQIIARCNYFIEEKREQPVTVKELAAVARVSERTLRNTFNEYFGLSPARYLKLRQLHQVYRALKSAEPKEVLVSDVMVSYGVWELGRFAVQYRQLFGKLPSETLKKR